MTTRMAKGKGMRESAEGATSVEENEINLLNSMRRTTSCWRRTKSRYAVEPMSLKQANTPCSSVQHSADAHMMQGIRRKPKSERKRIRKQQDRTDKSAADRLKDELFGTGEDGGCLSSVNIQT